jgi:hypothetical protein
MSLATAEWCVTYLQRFYSTAEDPHYIPLLNEKRPFTSLQSCRNCASGSILDVFGVRVGSFVGYLYFVLFLRL